MTDYDSVVAFSGGVESTALVYWLKTHNRNPFCFHVKNNPGEIQTIQQKASLLEVDVTTIHYDANPPGGLYLNRTLSQSHWKEHFNYNGMPPWQHNWAGIAYKVIIDNPYINQIFFGHNGGHLVKGDGKGDSFHAFGEFQYEGYIKSAATVGIDLDIVAPLAHLSKQEQYQMLPDAIKKTIFVCERGFQYHCMECKKCNELKSICSHREMEFYR